MSSIRVISLFSGCGGMDLGFLGGFEFLGSLYPRTTFDIIWANDNNPAACQTYRRNIGPHIVEGDIWEAMQFLPREADVVLGGFPCQDISINGKGLGLDGPRSGLYRAMVKVVELVRPRVFVAENVRGLLMKRNIGALQKVLRDFGELGYDVTYQLYNTADYGVPQTRERVIIIGTRLDMPRFVAPPPISSKWVTAEEALRDLEDRPWDTSINHIWSLAEHSPEQGNRKLKASRPGYTVRAECHGNIQFHYKLSRRISMREAARLQSFPDSFLFAAKLRETERQIGNAVPPVFAWHIAKAVERVFLQGSDVYALACQSARI